MKIEPKNSGFRPITIVLEDEIEAACLFALFNNIMIAGVLESHGMSERISERIHEASGVRLDYIKIHKDLNKLMYKNP